VGVVGAFPMERRRELFAELQPLDLIQVLSHPRGLLGRDPPTMGQPPLHLASATPGLAVPGLATAAPPTGLGWPLGLLGSHRIHQD
jgi:hypothetical protein